MKAELATLQQSVLQTEERVLASYEAHEMRAQERHEKVVAAFEALALNLKSYKKSDPPQ